MGWRARKTVGGREKQTEGRGNGGKKESIIWYCNMMGYEDVTLQCIASARGSVVETVIVRML